MSLTAEETSNSPIKTAVLRQLSSDINSALNASKGSKKKLRHISEKTGIHQKTLLRISRLENKPNYMTVFKIYRYLLNVNDDNVVIENSPAIIKKYLSENTPLKLDKTKSYTESVDLKISQNPIFAEIYVLCSISKVKSSHIQSRFGDYGLELIQQMCEEQILRHIGENEYLLGNNQASLTTESLVTLGKQFVNSYAKPKKSYENGNNCIYFMAEGLNNTSYQKWLEIDVKSHQLKNEILANAANHGKNKVFSFSVTDTIEKTEDDL